MEITDGYLNEDGIIVSKQQYEDCYALRKYFVNHDQSIVLFNNKRQPVHMDNLYWTNFKLFDHNRRLKTGKISYKKFKV